MKTLKCLAFTLAGLGFCIGSAQAYEVQTHQFMSADAAAQSVLGTDSSVLRDLGLPGYNDPSAPYVASDHTTTGNALIMLMQGALLEDNAPRFLNHFFDPQYNGFVGRGLQYGVVTGLDSPDWALQDRGVQSDPNGNTNAFAYRSAEAAFYAGLTGSTANGRNQSFSTMFEALGHIVHHIQDMGQPQHTRNDTHAHYPVVPLILTPGGFYEVYTANVGVPTQQAVDALVQAPNTYAPPNFATAREYWYAPGGYPSYRGMAEFTAENFVSQGTEFLNSSSTAIYAPLGYPYPNGTGKTVQTFTDTVTYPSGARYSGQVDYVVGSIYDGNTGQTLPPHRLASNSLLSVWTRPLGANIVWAENSAVFNDNYSVLIPRAVGYSAGLINHFFRGRLNLARSGATGTNWTISNVSASTTGALNGTFVVLAEDSNHNRTQIPGATWSLNIPAGGSTTVSFNEPAASTANLVLAFSGQIGAEPANFNDAGWFAVAGKVIKYTPPSTCTAPRSDSGSSAGITYTRDLGPVAGTVEIQFEAFSIPDGIQVKYANGHTPDPLAYTGLVSGFRDKTFQYDPVAAGTQQVQLQVTGNSDSNTEWVSVLGCPGQPISAANGGIPRETVQFNFGGALSGAAGSCSATVSIDGAVVGTAVADASSPHGFGVVLTKAVPQAPSQGSQHVLTYSSYQCTSNLRNVTTGGTYTDAAGTHPASDMSSLNPFLFDVN